MVRRVSVLRQHVSLMRRGGLESCPALDMLGLYRESPPFNLDVAHTSGLIRMAEIRSIGVDRSAHLTR